MFNLVYEHSWQGLPWPNLVPTQYQESDTVRAGEECPWIVPARLLYHCREHHYPHQILYLDQPIPEGSYYPVGIGWFSFDVDYFGLMSYQVHDLLRQGRIQVLFYYHEGDNPYREKTRLDYLCDQHNLPVECYRFISGNTRADSIDGFVYFADHELWYWRNSVVWNGFPQSGCVYHERPRTRQFTSLSRVHKWWRAAVQSELHRRGWLQNSYWSYNLLDISDQRNNNPIETYESDGLEEYMDQFLAGAPYICDQLTAQDHNSHWQYVPEHYENSYCNIVMETLFDAEQSGGTFLTEKTFKPIRHAQPFVIFGTAGSLSVLRDMGYKTFDHAIDNSYDRETNNTERFFLALEAIEQILHQDMHAWYIKCRDDIEHNQALFVSNKHNRLNELERKLKST